MKGCENIHLYRIKYSVPALFGQLLSGFMLTEALKEVTDIVTQLQSSLIRLENFQKLTELQRDLIGIENLTAPGRVGETLRWTLSPCVCLFFCLMSRQKCPPPMLIKKALSSTRCTPVYGWPCTCRAPWMCQSSGSMVF